MESGWHECFHRMQTFDRLASSRTDQRSRSMEKPAMAKAKKCAGIIQSGARKGSVKSNYRKQPGGRCPVKLSATSTRRRKSATSCRDIAKRVYKQGIAKGWDMHAKHKSLPKSIPTAARGPASYEQQAAALDRIYGQGMAGLGGHRPRKRRRSRKPRRS